MDSSGLVQKKCVPCEGGVPPFTKEQIEEYKPAINPEWEVVEDGHKLKRKFKFKDFKEAMAFVNKVSGVAEEEQHHPNIEIFYNMVNLTLWTHAIAGLSENDFIMSAKIDLI
ncbi:MAG: 4a-hydroxytetrahydrobiopterin dehydratase [Candidatus Levyibacteriota bacterium]